MRRSSVSGIISNLRQRMSRITLSTCLGSAFPRSMWLKGWPLCFAKHRACRGSSITTSRAIYGMKCDTPVEATFGNARAIPMRDYESVYCMEAPALEQYATLGLEIEGAQMKYPVGKRGEWEFCRDVAGHALMTTFQDYDWADEVLHVNIAKRQLAQWLQGGGEALSAIAEEGKANRTKVKQRYAPVQLNVPPDTLERARNSRTS